MNPGPPAPSPESIACPDCGLLQQLPHVEPGLVAECRRCRCLFARPVTDGNARARALLAAALLTWIPASIGALMVVSSSGATREASLSSAIGALWGGGFPFLAIVVTAFSLLVPWVYLLLLLGVLMDVPVAAKGALRGRLFRWVLQLRPWTMLEVYLLGCCVAYSRIRLVASIDVEACGWCFVATTLLMLLALAALDERSIWERLPTRGARPAGSRSAERAAPAIACLSCDLVVPAPAARCSRCAAALHTRKPRSLERTLALVLCGFLLYVPANLLPVLTIERYGRIETNTILGGVRELMQSGLWPLAAIVFTASVLIPLGKLCGLSWMLFATRRGSARALLARTRIYRLIDAVGRWSNIDVFMISILVALVQFGVLTRVRVQSGAVAFAAVVIVTMLASKTFDARLMWDSAGARA